jgi:hypothetical protein
MPLLHYVFSDSVNRYYEHKELKKIYKGIVVGEEFNTQGGSSGQEDELLREIQKEEAEYFNQEEGEEGEEEEGLPFDIFGDAL